MKIPYGYSLNELQEVIINKDKADIVKRIYDLYLQGKSLGGIAQDLESQNMPSPSGNETWSRPAIDKILSNKKYIPAIIPFEKYVEVQFEKDRRSNMQENNTRKTVRYNSQNVLSGLLICGECGKNYRRITRANGDVVWRCGDKVENGRNSACGNSNAVSDSEIKSLLCAHLALDEYDEQIVGKEVESILIYADRIDIIMNQQIENTFIL